MNSKVYFVMQCMSPEIDAGAFRAAIDNPKALTKKDAVSLIFSAFLFRGKPYGCLVDSCRRIKNDRGESWREYVVCYCHKALWDLEKAS